jgi:3',5'-cyclic AMP phosphodiesterase CpdA
MFIGQITDLHILKDRTLAYGVGDTSFFLEETEKYLFNLKPPLDALVITGDLADRGEKKAYEFIRDVFSRWKIPIWVTPGNHENRFRLKDALGNYCPRGDFDLWPNLSYIITLKNTKIIMLDSTVDGKYGGSLSLKTAKWLMDVLKEDTDKDVLKGDIKAPIMIFTHHPPFFSYMGELDKLYDNLEILLWILENHPNVILCAGHLHIPMSVGYKGGRAIVAPPVSLPMHLDITPTGGGNFNLGAPGYAIHHIKNGTVNTHFGQVPGKFEFTGPYSFSHQNISIRKDTEKMKDDPYLTKFFPHNNY